MLKTFRPKTPGTRRLVLVDHQQLSRIEGRKEQVKPTKSLLVIRKRQGGRNNNGRVTCRHHGGGHKRFLRLIDFKRDKLDIPAKVASIEYDPNRSAYVALLNYADGEKRYIIAPQDLQAGATVISSDKNPVIAPGCTTQLKSIPVGSVIHNIELIPGKGAKIVRSAGLSAQVMGRAAGFVTLRLPSGEMRNIHENCRATFGAVSNPEHNVRVEGKAGRVRWQGVRPTVRGTAMNPIDHPHGGGEGKHNGYIPQTPWAMQTKGYKTRSKRKVTSRFIIKDRRD
jgi:large subunit ribosomal protein L2